MTQVKKIVCCSAVFGLLSLSAFSQEVLKSVEETYYDFLSLTGNTERNYLNYRTLEESRWTVTDEDETKDVWADKNLGKRRLIWERQSEERNFFTRGLDNSFAFKVYGAEWYSSYNKNAPFGQNDGGLWQGRGYNTALSAGARIEGFGFSLSFRPQLSFSQNLDYTYLVEGYKSSNYAGKADTYGYVWGQCDAVQRFGDSSFWNFDWGDTEIRWSWYTFTVGFGTEAIWLGPAVQNALLHSNNAPTYPKLDFGFRRTQIKIPHFGWYLGDIEARLWVGYLSESDYFDNDSSNDHNQFSGFTVSYAPSFLPGLTLGFQKVTVSKWGDALLLYAYPGFKGNTVDTSKRKGEDQKASFTADWLFKKIGLEIYGEIGVDDFLADGLKFYEYTRYPLHTITYTAGIKKSLEISQTRKLRGLLEFEWNNTEGSQDYQMWSGSAYNFGFHYQITQGYTNRGQWIGSGMGYGGNSQYLAFTLFSPHGYEKLFVARNNPDNNFIYYKSVDADKDQTNYNGARYFTAFKANFYVGFENLYYVLKNLSIQYGFLYNLIINPTYEPEYNANTMKWRGYSYQHNFQLKLAVKYHL
ncbi:MAG: hypothetical protein IJS09_05985 [Treponema sp.]|nr:hypothetical protein [Treponema sp.]